MHTYKQYMYIHTITYINTVITYKQYMTCPHTHVQTYKKNIYKMLSTLLTLRP